MTYLLILIVGIIMGLCAGLTVCMLMLAHKPPGITKNARTPERRRWRDLPVEEPETVEPIYMYGVTGLEE